ncbi:hypothetical protein D3C87_37350 [compost metagenome]
MNEEVSQKLAGSLNSLRIVFGGLLFGMLSFLAVMTLIIKGGSEQTASNELFQLIAPIFMVTAVSVSIFLRKSTLAKVHNETNPLNLIKAYTSNRIVQMGLVDASIIFAIVCFVLTSNTYFVILSGIGILYFISLFPIRKKVVEQLKLDSAAGF